MGRFCTYTQKRVSKLIMIAKLSITVYAKQYPALTFRDLPMSRVVYTVQAFCVTCVAIEDLYHQTAPNGLSKAVFLVLLRSDER